MWNPMGFVVSLIVVAVGAILVWAVENDPEGVDLDVVGWVLIVFGLVAFVLTLLLWSSWGERYGARRRRVVYDDDPHARRTVVERPAARRTVVEEEDVVPPPAGPPPP